MYIFFISVILFKATLHITAGSESTDGSVCTLQHLCWRSCRIGDAWTKPGYYQNGNRCGAWRDTDNQLMDAHGQMNTTRPPQQAHSGRGYSSASLSVHSSAAAVESSLEKHETTYTWDMTCNSAVLHVYTQLSSQYVRFSWRKLWGKWIDPLNTHGLSFAINLSLNAIWCLRFGWGKEWLRNECTDVCFYMASLQLQFINRADWRQQTDIDF